MTYPIAYATEKRRAELRAMPYGEYLRTPEWSQVRWFALCRDGFSCVFCAAADSLHVHHRRYDNRGAERGDDVVTLCERCHRKHHGISDAPRTERDVHAAALDVVPPREASAIAMALLEKLKGL